MKKVEQENIDRFRQRAATWDESPTKVALSEGIFSGLVSRLPLTTEMGALEIGAGTGLLTVPMAGKVKNVAAFDLSMDMLDVLKKKMAADAIDNIRIHPTDFPSEEIEGTAFDLIYSAMTMHHMEDVGAILKQVYRFLKPGGYLAIGDLEKEDGTFHGDNKGICHFGFEEEEIGELARGSGFEVQSIHTVHTIQKEISQGESKEYPVFLLVGQK